MTVVQRGPDVFQASGEERLLESVSVSAQYVQGASNMGRTEPPILRHGSLP